MKSHKSKVATGPLKLTVASRRKHPVLTHHTIEDRLSRISARLKVIDAVHEAHDLLGLDVSADLMNIPRIVEDCLADISAIEACDNSVLKTLTKGATR